MGFLKKFFRNVFRDGTGERPPGGFDRLSEDELETHLRVAKYGDFMLTEAIRPSYGLDVVPRQGYRHDCYRDDQTKTKVPVLMISASSEKLFDLFIDLLDPLGQEVDLVLETSHTRDNRGHTDLYREHIDLPVLKSMLYDYEEMLTHDGCTGIAVLNPNIPLEVQFDEHKLIIVYGHDLSEFEAILADHGIRCDDQMKFITEAEHVHSSSDDYIRRFDEMKMVMGIDSPFDQRGERHDDDEDSRYV
ncbi:MAG: hypothetical protein QM811_19315 [Pirellulales bacterium]